MDEGKKGEDMGQVIQIDEARIKDHLGEMVRGTVEETLNALLDAEADRLCGACRGLVESVAEYLPDARWQRCMVHFYRNVFSHVPSSKVREVSHMLKAIHAQESREAAQEKAGTVLAALRRQRLVRAAELIEESIGETLTYYAFPDSHWRKIRTNNPLERIMKEIRRRTRVVGAFPDGQSCLNLAAARLRHIAAGKWATRKYMDMKPLFEDKTSTQGAVA